MQLNLNADLGESFGAWTMGDDDSLLQIVNSANVACGFHAGDPLVMKQTLLKAKANHVTVGAHPGFDDLQGFGRRPMKISDEEVETLMLYQLSALSGMANTLGHPISHVKPHGALNNLACEDKHLANIIVKAVHDFDPSLIFLAPAVSELEIAGREIGLPVASEIFADRAYNDDGTLVSRKIHGSVSETADQCIEHVRSMISANGLVSQSGKILLTDFQSICVHGDSEHSVEIASKISLALKSDGHELVGLDEFD